MRLQWPTSMQLAIASVVCLGSAAVGITLQSCNGVAAQAGTGCQQLGHDVGTLSQTWAIANPPADLKTGAYVVTLSNGDAEIAGISLGGSELLITIPVPAAQIPAGGIGINTVQINGQWVQLGCPAIAP